jgi:hypothetical protein
VITASRIVGIFDAGLERSGVVDDVVGGRAPRLARGLAADDRAHFVLGKAAAGAHPGKLQVFRHIDHQHPVDAAPVVRRLDE